MPSKKVTTLQQMLAAVATFVMVLVLLVLSSSWQAIAAGKTSTTQKITLQKKLSKKSAPKSPAPTSTKNSLAFLEKKFDSLAKDNTAGKLRHSWVQLEGQFAKHTKSDRSAFFQARCKEELANRSFSPADHKAALKSFQQMAMAWPKSAFAPKALYRATVIAYQKTKDTETAKQLAKKLIQGYPSSKEKSDVEQLLSSIKTTASDNTRITKKEKKGLAEQLGLTAKTVMIDAGHGGKDPGARGNKVIERVLTLKVALLVGKELKKKGFTVLYTHTSNIYLALNERTELANKNNVDIFLSIHANASTDSSISGLETYYFDSASNSASAKVAARENSVSVKDLSNLQFIISDLMLGSKTQESKMLATDVHQSILTIIRSSKYNSLYDHGVRTAPFYVLMGARMPAILVEMGYLSNKSDAANLKNDEYLTLLSQAIASGVARYRESIAQSLR